MTRVNNKIRESKVDDLPRMGKDLITNRTFSTMRSRMIRHRTFPSKDESTNVDYYRKRGSASYIVREVHSVREREREIQREKDGSDVTNVALKLAMNLHFPFAKNSHNWR